MIWVVGVARTGTSMLMRRLDHGGLPAVHEPNPRPVRNPHGNYESPTVQADPVGALAELPARCVVKLFGWSVLPAIRAGVLPDAVLITRRSRGESDASVLEAGTVTAEQVAASSRWDVFREAVELLTEHEVPTLTVDFHHAIDHPREDAQRIADFLAPWVTLDVAAMAAVPDPAHRHFDHRTTD